MARIRSIHPSLFTDEAYMGLSLVSRVVLPGIWTECDDQGVFAWKPLTLKARILPADNAEMTTILAELMRADFIIKFQHDGKDFGAVRNFRKFQRPKKPNSVHQLPAELRTYVGLGADYSPPVSHQFSTEGETAVQIEDGGDGMEGNENINNSAPFIAVPPSMDQTKGRCSLPPHFPHEDDQGWAREHWLGKGREDLCNAINDEIAKFRDHHRSKATVSAHWPGSWRTWVRNAVTFNRKQQESRDGARAIRKPTATDQHLFGIAEIIRDGRKSDD
jgi:hypothetical protein